MSDQIQFRSAIERALNHYLSRFPEGERQARSETLRSEVTLLLQVARTDLPAVEDLDARAILAAAISRAFPADPSVGSS